MPGKIAPLAPKNPVRLGPLRGVQMAAMEAGIKYTGRKDLLLMVFDQPTSVAGVFTTSKCPSAPVDWCRESLGTNGKAKALVVNSGNANAFTGKKGRDAAKMTADAASGVVGCLSSEVYLASTGVIGEPLDASSFDEHLASLKASRDADRWQDAAEAIMTTDTYPKLAHASFELDGETCTINGIAKGSGMIAPDMATMLSFVVTDAPVASSVLQELVSQLVVGTFNAVTVDSDTSTSDTLMLFATGCVAVSEIKTSDDARIGGFKTALQTVLHDLAMQVVRDGEGATKHVEVHVTGAVDDASARQIAQSIANSPLVKTAVAGEDANWGRVVMAVGKAGEPADRDLLAISFGDIRVALAGERDPHYSEDAATAVMRQDEITIGVDIGLGDGSAKIWTCDLTKAYVAINGDYRS